MAKLHELLAVVSNLETQAARTREELEKTFSTKRHLFEEKRTTYNPLAEGEGPVTESQKDIESTVRQELTWIKDILAKAMDVNYQIDVGNTMARADVVTEDGETILKQVPTTFLLQLNKRLTEIMRLLNSIPTLDPAKGFAVDAQRGTGIYKAREVIKPKTKKIQEPVVLYAHTKEHAAQVQLVSKDVVVGSTLEQEWSAMLTPADKSDLLARCSIMARAVQKALSKGNEQNLDVEGLKIGATILNFILQPVL